MVWIQSSIIQPQYSGFFTLPRCIFVPGLIQTLIMPSLTCSTSTHPWLIIITPYYSPEPSEIHSRLCFLRCKTKSYWWAQAETQALISSLAFQFSVLIKISRSFLEQEKICHGEGNFNMLEEEISISQWSTVYSKRPYKCNAACCKVQENSWILQ